MAQEIYRAIVDGILIGGVYALMAVGLTLIFAFGLLGWFGWRILMRGD